MRRLRRVLVTVVKAIVACHAQRAAPTLTTVFEIAALASPLVKDGVAGGGDTQQPTAAARRGRRLAGVPLPVQPARLALAVGLRLARGWAPAVVVAQGVRLVGSLVGRVETDGGKPAREGTEVRALQLGLTVVPRVDPRVPRPLAEYCTIYREWLLLLRGRMAAAAVELPEGLFDEGELPGGEGDQELMRFALTYNILQARSLKDALVAMERTVASIRELSGWRATYCFIAPEDLAAWQRIAWFEGPDEEGHLWLMVDFRAAVHAARTHGPEMVARVLVSNVEYAVRELIPELGCAGTLRVVVDSSDVHAGAALRNRGVLLRVGHVVDRMYPCRLQVVYMVGLPPPARWTLRAAMQLLRPHTRRKVRLVRPIDVPRRLPSQLRSHRLSVAGGLDAWAAPWDAASAWGGESRGDGGPLAHGCGTAGGSAVGSDYGGDVGPFTPRLQLRTPRRGGAAAAAGAFRWRRSRLAPGGAASPAAAAAEQPAAGAARGVRQRARLPPRLAWAGGLLVLLAGALALLALAAGRGAGGEALVAAMAARLAAFVRQRLRRMVSSAAAATRGGGQVYIE